MSHRYRRCERWRITRWQRLIWHLWRVYPLPALTPTLRRQHPRRIA